MLGVVNCFMLEGQVNNYSDPEKGGSTFNVERWKLMLEKLNGKNILSKEDVKNIMTSGPAIYNTNTQQIMIYIPAQKYLEVFFKPGNSTPLNPEFIIIPLN